ncbi:unnamed protein product, partial [Didymodactylos carnosus]
LEETCLPLVQKINKRESGMLDDSEVAGDKALEHLTIDVFNYKDLLVAFDNFPSLTYLSVELGDLSVFYLPMNQYIIDDGGLVALEKIFINMIYLTKLRFFSIVHFFAFNLVSLPLYGTRISEILLNIPDLEELQFQLEFEMSESTCLTPSYRSVTEEAFRNINKWNVVFNFDEERNHYSIFTLPAMSNTSYRFHLLSSTLFYSSSNHDYSNIRQIEIFESSSHPIVFSELAEILTENFSKLTSLTISAENISKSETCFDSKLRLNHLIYLRIKRNISYLGQLLLLVPNLKTLVIHDIQCLQNISVKNNIEYLSLFDCNHLPKLRTILNNYFQNINGLELQFRFIESTLSCINDKEISMFCEMINNMKNLVSLRIFISSTNENVDHYTNIMYETLRNKHDYCLIQTIIDEKQKNILVWK